MDNSHLFYRYYDTLFAAKDYAGEVAAVMRYCADRPVAKILEIGCGTGNHTLELAGYGEVSVNAVDIDAEMLSLAKIKADKACKVNIAFSSVVNTCEKMDLCVALFNVVNYVCPDGGLEAFFVDIAKSLRDRGVFIFDCWNGAAALLDPPGSKYYEQYCGDRRISCHLTSHTDIALRMTTLNYQLDLYDKNGDRIQSGDYQIKHRLWTPDEIRNGLLEAGFAIETVCTPFRFGSAAAETDWKIMFACRKV